MINCTRVVSLCCGAILVYTAMSFIILKSAKTSSDIPVKLHNSGINIIGPVWPALTSFFLGLDINKGC